MKDKLLGDEKELKAFLAEQRTLEEMEEEQPLYRESDFLGELLLTPSSAARQKFLPGDLGYCQWTCLRQNRVRFATVPGYTREDHVKFGPFCEACALDHAAQIQQRSRRERGAVMSTSVGKKKKKTRARRS